MAIDTLNLRERLGDFPTNCNDQQSYMSTLLSTMDTYLNAVKNLSAETVVIAQVSEPTQAQWESKWLETHETLPIPPSAILVWYDTLFNRVGKVYGTITGVAGILSREPNVANGAIVALDSAYLPAGSDTTTANIGGVAGLPSIDFYLPRPSKLILYTSFYVAITSGSGEYGVDFDLDGDKIGTLYDAVPSDYGIHNFDVDATVNCEYILEDVPAGNHTASLLFGVVGSPGAPPTLQYTNLAPDRPMYFSIRAVALD